MKYEEDFCDCPKCGAKDGLFIERWFESREAMDKLGMYDWEERCPVCGYEDSYYVANDFLDLFFGGLKQVEVGAIKEYCVRIDWSKGLGIEGEWTQQKDVFNVKACNNTEATYKAFAILNYQASDYPEGTEFKVDDYIVTEA
jgi:hypothetical protein